MKAGRQTMWWGKKIVPASVLTTLFWRDKDTVCDVNYDYTPEGMDVPLTTHILAINEANNWKALSLDENGEFDSVEIGNRIIEYNNDLTCSTGSANVTLCALAVPFRVTHNVSPASYALGHECNDCHGAAAGMFNGPYRLQGDQMKMSLTADQVHGAYTTVNSPYPRKTDFHFKLVNKGCKVSIPLAPFSGYSGNLTSVDRSDLLYDGNFTASGSVTAVNGTTYLGDSGKAGWVDYLNNIDDLDCTCYPDANASVCSGNFTVQGLHGYGIGCNCGNSTYPHCVSDLSPITGCSGAVGVTDIVYGVNATDDYDYEHCVNSSIWDIYEVKVCEPICFEADPLPCGGEYYWNFNDASGFLPGTQFSAVDRKVSHEFRDLGIFKVVLTVKNIYGNVDSEMILVNVVK
jgi:hypothetical protein